MLNNAYSITCVAEVVMPLKKNNGNKKINVVADRYPIVLELQLSLGRGCSYGHYQKKPECSPRRTDEPRVVPPPSCSFGPR
jgi:hypothetical protein